MSTTKSPFGNILLWCVAILSLIFSSVSLVRSFMPASKVASIDAVKLITQYAGVDELKRSAQERRKALQANVDTLKMELRWSLQEYQKVKSGSSKKEIEELEDDIRSRQENLINYEQAIAAQIKKSDEEVAVELTNRVSGYVKRYGEKNGYTIILASTNSGNVAYAEDNVDITDQVLTGMNNEYKRSK
jgi:outer membrane protein